jgi:hypothetical protein
MKILEHEQRTPEWYAARCGIPTASGFDKIITSTGKRSTSRERYLYELAGQKLGGVVEETFQSFAMQRGTIMEAEARSLYEFSRDSVQTVGFCLSDCGRWGFSPDGLVGEKGGVEIKCPLIHTHVKYMVDCKDEMPAEYFPQVQGALLVSGREWWDFVSYYPGLPPVIVREEPNLAFQRLLRQELEAFCDELDQLVKKLS